MKCKNFLLFFSSLIFFLSIFLYWSFDTSYEEIEMPESSKAKCLDGSPYKFLFSKGFGNGTSSFYIYLEAGGFCGDEVYSPENEEGPLKLCSIIKNRRLGSNKYIFMTRYFNKIIQRYFGSSKIFNPIFYNWNKVYVKYCDGTLHMGNLENPVIYNGTKLYVRGEENIKSVFEFLLKNKNFSNSKNVVLVGSSAGGLASIIYSKYVRSLLSRDTKYKVISDSGYFLEKNYSLAYGNRVNVMRDMITKIQNSFKLSKTQTMEFNNCKNSDFVNCVLPKSYINNFNKDYEILFLTSAYDSWALSRILRTKCFFGKNVYDGCNKTEIDMFEKYAGDVLEEFNDLVNGDKNGKITAWINKGFFHMYLFGNWFWNNKKYAVGELTIDKVVHDWYYELLPSSKKIFYENEVKKNLIDFIWILNYFQVKY